MQHVSAVNAAVFLRATRKNRSQSRSDMERIQSVHNRRLRLKRYRRLRTDALRMSFQEVAWTARGVVGIAHRAARAHLLLRSSSVFSRRLVLPGVARIAAVVASTTADRCQERRRGHSKKCMSHV